MINNAINGGHNKFRVIEGLYGKGTVTLVHPKNSRLAIRHQGYRVKLHTGRSLLWRKDASYFAGRFRMKGMGNNAVSFRSANYPAYYLAHNYHSKAKGQGALYIRKFNMRNVKRFAGR